MSKGKVIVIEGIDGSGKETQVNKLKERFDKENIRYKTISFPNYDSPSSSLVKMYLAGEFGRNANDVNPYIASTFYAVDRYATYKKELEEYYNNGGLILMDRYTTSNMIHQVSKIKDKKEVDRFLDWLWDFEFSIFKLPTPDMVFFLNMPPEYGQKLTANRSNKITHEKKKDIHESDLKHLQKSYEGALYVTKKYNWYEIDCIVDNNIRTIEDIHEDIYNKIKEKIL